jgi:predicted heme/steroid binding protein
MKPWLFVGAKVVCVDASDIRESGLQEGRAYIVRKVGPLGTSNRGRIFAYRGKPYDASLIAVWVEGIHRKAFNTEDGKLICGDFPFKPERFRPVSTIDTAKTVEAMRSLMLDATVRGKVTA